MALTKYNLQKSPWIYIVLCILISGTGIQAQKIYLGFGGGVNASRIINGQTVNLYENLSLEPQEESYGEWYRNIGNQYFFHAEYRLGKLILFGTPGTSTYRFTKTTPIIGGTETVNQENPFVLRYFSIPLGVKFFIGGDMAKPYFGGKATYGQLLQGGGPDNSIIPSRFSAGALLGTYIEPGKFTIDVNAGYNLGLHKITRQGERYSNDGNGLTSQNNIRLNDIQFNVSVLIPFEKSWHMNSLDCNYKKR